MLLVCWGMDPLGVASVEVLLAMPFYLILHVGVVCALNLMGCGTARCCKHVTSMSV